MSPDDTNPPDPASPHEPADAALPPAPDSPGASHGPEGEKPESGAEAVVEALTEPIQELVEEIKEEIHEVVEHVPEPVRWTVGKIVLLGVLGFFGLIALVIVSAALYVANRTEWVAQEITVVVNQALATRSDLVLQISDLRGNPLTGVHVMHPIVRFRDGKGPPLLEAREMQMRYSAWRLVTGGEGPIEIDIDRPVLQLSRGADGKVRFPKWRSGPSRGKGRRLDIGITLHNGTVNLPIAQPPILGLEARARLALGEGTNAYLDRFQFRSGPWGSSLDQLRASYESGDSVHVRVSEMRSPDVALTARAAWKSSEKERHVHADIDRVRWAFLAKVFDNGVFDVPGMGRFSVDAAGDRDWRADFAGDLTWNGLPADGKGHVAYVNRRVVVEPLEAKTPSGTILGKFEWAAGRWTLTADGSKVDPRAWHAFKLDGWPQGDLNGAFVMTQNDKHDFDLRARLLSSELAGWRADSALVRFHAPAATTDTFDVDFFRRGGEFSLRAGTRSWGWLGGWSAARLPLDEWPDGRASGLRGTLTEGHGGVESRAGALTVEGDMAGTQSDWLGAHLARWRMSGVSGRLLPTPDLDADVDLRDLMFLGLHFDSSRVAFRLGDRQASLDSVSAWAGDTTVRVAGLASWQTDGWQIQLDRADARSLQFHWTADAPALLAGDPRGVDFRRLIAHDGNSRLECAGRWAAPGGVYSFDARAHALDIGRIGLPLEWGLGGRADAQLSVRGPNGDPRWNFSSRCQDPEQSGHRADSLDVALEGAKSLLIVQHCDLGVGGGWAHAAGRVERTAAPWPDTLTADGVVKWLAGGASWQGDARVQQIALEQLERLTPKPMGWSGRLNGNLQLSGSPTSPEFDVKADVQPFGWREFRVDGLGLQSQYSNGRLRVNELKVTRGAVVSTINGSLPLRLALGQKPDIPDESMDWIAKIPNGDLALLPVFVPQIGWARGRFDLSARVGGTARSPQLAGTTTVRDGAIRLAGREEILDRIAADFHFDQSRVTLDSLRGRQGQEGSVRGKGVVELSGLGLKGYRFDLQLRQFTAVEEGLYAAQFDGDFAVTNGPRVHGATIPEVTGNVGLRSAAVLFDFANQSETQQLAATTQPLFWTYRVQVEASRNLHWQPPDGDIEFSADLTLEQTPDSLLIYGDLQSLRGTYYFLSNRFDVTRANLTFDNETGVDPQLDIEATTKIVSFEGASSGGEALSSADSSGAPHTVTATITGRADEPVVEFSSEPADWDQPRILRELTVGRFFDARAGGVQLGDPLDNYLTRAINRTMSAEMSRVFKGYINEWAIEREQGGLLMGEGDVVLGVGTQLTPNISLRYRQRLPGFTRQGPTTDPGDAFERDVEAEYRLSRFIYVTTELTQRRSLGGTTTTTTSNWPDFNVNLKARWEY
jgi:hypothetical protein